MIGAIIGDIAGSTYEGTVKYYAQIHLQVWQHANKSTMYPHDRGGNMT